MPDFIVIFFDKCQVKYRPKMILQPKGQVEDFAKTPSYPLVLKGVTNREGMSSKFNDIVTSFVDVIWIDE